MDTRLDEHTVAAVCKYSIAIAGATLLIQQSAKTSKLSTCVAKIVEMLVSAGLSQRRTFGNVVDLL